MPKEISHYSLEMRIATISQEDHSIIPQVDRRLVHFSKINFKNKDFLDTIKEDISITSLRLWGSMDFIQTHQATEFTTDHEHC